MKTLLCVWVIHTEIQNHNYYWTKVCYLCGVYTQVIKVQSYSHEGCQVQWLFSFHINSEVETILFQVLYLPDFLYHRILNISELPLLGICNLALLSK